ncbi:tRNA glutamyl-Q(34) synthetase GluQRS [Gordonia alkanivorans]|uniref:tRNA glutamyl-Q(34) synthetase GluQRS n=1 Tax=Gordonia alkanivorans TaxID=84096 RepID=UPI0004B8984C|nr:tRNA glutamyl-Q(34) synthetase GluQRS [Gordonia alkanivorans]MDH3013333.1 tRNA glutamyl-Q(34) synthetase GluQRS [Gordonia alkanivorans]MDH3045777.1 tRNA glutamyl-Q(34) synthetase GluQRS [Gordonia alkanivorans]
MSTQHAAGRYAPSPSGDLHVGNLRTALLAWLFARTTGRRFLIRMEDLDRAVAGADARQLADLASLGMDWETPVVYQTQRRDIYGRIIDRLRKGGRTFECFCTRREILEAPSAPHAPQGAYPGTCRNLTDAERAEKIATGRPPAIRILADTTEFTVTDLLHGTFTGMVDDFVIQRNDGTPAYNLAVVVDDAAQGVDQVVRGDDLLSSAPRQAYLATLLGETTPTYAHVPMVLNTDGVRLSKRDGAVTLADLAADGVPATTVLSHIARSLDLADPGETVDLPTLASRFDPDALPREPWLLGPTEWSS